MGRFLILCLLDIEDNEIEVDDTARVYRAHFLGFEHFNFYGMDERLGSSVLVSLKIYRDEEENEKCARAIVRLATGTIVTRQKNIIERVLLSLCVWLEFSQQSFKIS